MQQRREKEWELTIGPDTVRMLIEKAKAVSAAVVADYDDGHEREIELDGNSRDSHHHDGLIEEQTEDLGAEELRELINDLNVDEAAELIALMWIGRGDYEPAEWADAVAAARERGRRGTWRYLMGIPTAGDWIEDGLEALGA